MELEKLAESCGRLHLALRAASAYLRNRTSFKVADYLWRYCR